MSDVVIVAALRTAVGSFSGTLSNVPAVELGAHVIKGLLAKAGLKPEQISDVILGQVLTAGAGQNPARQSLIKAGLPVTVPGMTINLEQNPGGVRRARVGPRLLFHRHPRFWVFGSNGTGNRRTGRARLGVHF